MNRKVTVVLTAVFASLFSFSALSDARTRGATGALSAKQQRIVTISAFAAQGNMARLKTALNEGLDAGLTVNEIKEILAQLYAYAGFPRSLNALGAFMGVLEERKKKGIKDKAGRRASPLPPGKSILDLGVENQTRLVGRPVVGKSEAENAAGVFDGFLKKKK
jgi:alkylhydroperoxidase/carboxymuconolactone decarboxylase family protein YurZ